MKFLFACICFAGVAYINAKPSSYSAYSAPAPYEPAHRQSYHHAPAYAPAPVYSAPVVVQSSYPRASASAAASASASSRNHYSQYVVPSYETYGSGAHSLYGY